MSWHSNAASRPCHVPVKSSQGTGEESTALIGVYIKWRSLSTNNTARDAPQQGASSSGTPRLTAGRGSWVLEADPRPRSISLPPTASAVYCAPFTLQTCRENFPSSHFPVRAVKPNPALICQKHFSADIFNKYFQLLNTFVGAISPPFFPLPSPPVEWALKALIANTLHLSKASPPLPFASWSGGSVFNFKAKLTVQLNLAGVSRFLWQVLVMKHILH